jgi:predicted phage terminase large subunit-like protein
LNATDVHSDAHRKQAIRWVTEVLPSRLDDPENATRILVGQRLHPSDPISVAEDHGWSHLVLPALATDEPCELRRDDGSLIWRDPRQPGEPLFALLDTDALARLKTELGSQQFAAQYQQRPFDDASAMFKRSGFTRRWSELPPAFEQTVIAVDATFKKSDTADYCVVQCWGSKGRDRFLIEQWRRQSGFSESLTAIKSMIARHPFAKVLIESAANGHAILEELQRALPQVFDVKADGGKVARATSVQAICEGCVVILPDHAPWVDDFVDEVASFPAGKNDDCLDCMVYALRALQDPIDPEYEEKRKLRVSGILSIKPNDIIGDHVKVIRWLDEQLRDRYPEFAPARQADYPTDAERAALRR